jgi:hypothetical protein
VPLANRSDFSKCDWILGRKAMGIMHAPNAWMMTCDSSTLHKVSVPIPKLYLFLQLSLHSVFISSTLGSMFLEHASQAKASGLGTLTEPNEQHDSHQRRDEPWPKALHPLKKLRHSSTVAVRFPGCRLPKEATIAKPRNSTTASLTSPQLRNSLRSPLPACANIIANGPYPPASLSLHLHMSTLLAHCWRTDHSVNGTDHDMDRGMEATDRDLVLPQRIVVRHQAASPFERPGEV